MEDPVGKRITTEGYKNPKKLYLDSTSWLQEFVIDMSDAEAVDTKKGRDLRASIATLTNLLGKYDSLYANLGTNNFKGRVNSTLAKEMRDATGDGLGGNSMSIAHYIVATAPISDEWLKLSRTYLLGDPEGDNTDKMAPLFSKFIQEYNGIVKEFWEKNERGGDPPYLPDTINNPFSSDLFAGNFVVKIDGNNAIFQTTPTITIPAKDSTAPGAINYGIKGLKKMIETKKTSLGKEAEEAVKNLSMNEFKPGNLFSPFDITRKAHVITGLGNYINQKNKKVITTS